MDLVQLTIATLFLGMWALYLIRRDRGVVPTPGRASIKFTHLLPAVLQIVLFTYWAIYWPGVLEHLPSLVAQLVFAYTFDYLLQWSLRRSYTPGFGPVPIVLSANLFVWFTGEHAFLHAVVITGALLSKALMQRNGRHVFNPSVFGIAIAAALCIALPGWFRYEDISHAFDQPPHMAVVIVLLALIPQVRLRTTPVAVGASLSMIGVMAIVAVLTGYTGGPSPWWPPWLLAITLLAGDPATIPSGSVGRLLFGLFLGFAFYAASRLLLFGFGTDFFSKILPIPMANWLVPTFESVGARLTARWPTLQSKAADRAYIAIWLTASVVILAAAGRE